MNEHPNQLPQTTKLLRVGIDGNEANIDQRVGSNVYAYELIKNLELITRNNPNFQATIFLSSKPLTDLPDQRTGWHYHILKSKKFATQWALPLALFKMRKQLDIFFTPGHYAPRMSPVPYISSVMDLAFLHFPKQFKFKDLLQLKLWTQYSVRNAKHVIAISEYTRQDIQQKYHKQADRISVIYPAENFNFGGKRENQKVKQELFFRLGIHSPYILYVGTLQPRKNLIRLVEAFEHFDLQQQSALSKKTPTGKKKKKSNEQTSSFQLILAGKVGWLSQELLSRIDSSPARSKIILAGYVAEEEKKILLSNAACSVLIGLYEGFGMPALEALFYGTPTVVSNTTSLPEVVGDAGILVDPYNIDSIQKGLNKAVFMNQKNKKEFLAKAKTQVRKFSWEHSAHQLLEVFTKLA